MDILRILKLFYVRADIKSTNDEIEGIEGDIEGLKGLVKDLKGHRASLTRKRVNLENEIVKKETDVSFDLNDSVSIVFLDTKGDVVNEVTKRPALLEDGEIREFIT